MIAAVFISDRGDLYLPGALESFHACQQSQLIDDDNIHVVDDSEHKLGMAGAVKAGWAWALERGADYVLHIEEDFRLYDLPLRAMQWRLDHGFEPFAQVVLKRQPWSDEEKAAGGQMETNPGAYVEDESSDLRVVAGEMVSTISWVEHRTLFSLNPCLIPRRTLELEWTPGNQGAERAITDACLAAGMRFAYYGRKSDPPRCEHVGFQRSAGYRW